MKLHRFCLEKNQWFIASLIFMFKSQTKPQVKMACGSKLYNAADNQTPLSEEVDVFTIKTCNSFESWEQSCGIRIMKTGISLEALKCVSMAKGLQNRRYSSFQRECWDLVPVGDSYHLFCTPSFFSGQVCLWTTSLRQ